MTAMTRIEMIDNPSIQVFEYDTEKDAFTVNIKYLHYASMLGLTEWNAVVWIGRLFCMDNDFGEHWFDNWDLMDKKNLDYDKHFALDESRFKDGHDGPCHSDTVRRMFWMDVLKSFKISIGTMIQESRECNKAAKESSFDEDMYIPDLEDRIAEIMEVYCNAD